MTSNDFPQTFTNFLTSLKKTQASVNLLKKIEPDVSKRYQILKKQIQLFEKNFGTKNDWDQIFDNASGYISSRKSELKEIESGIKGKFGLLLQSLLLERGFKLEGQYPILKTSFYTLVVDIDRSKVVFYYGPQIEKLGECNASAQEVVDNLVKYHAQISERTFSEQDFFKSLFFAYQFSLTKLGKKMGEEVGILDIIPPVSLLMQPKKFQQDPKKANYSEYGRVYFSYDLARLTNRNQNMKELRLVPAVRGKTKNQYEFLYVPNIRNPGQWDQISGLKFLEVQGG